MISSCRRNMFLLLLYENIHDFLYTELQNEVSVFHVTMAPSQSRRLLTCKSIYNEINNLVIAFTQLYSEEILDVF